MICGEIYQTGSRISRQEIVKLRTKWTENKGIILRKRWNFGEEKNISKENNYKI